MSFDPDLTFAGGYLTSSVINFFKIQDTDGNLICGADTASVNGSIAPYNGDYTQIRANQGWTPTDQAGQGIAAHFFGTALNISINNSGESVAFKFKDASTSTLYPVTITGVFGTTTYTNATTVLVDEATTVPGNGYGDVGQVFDAAVEPIIFTVDLAAAPSDTTAPVITLNGDATVNHEVGQSYSDAGAIATDDTDQSPTISITITKDDAAFNDAIETIGYVTGTYIITYSAQDAAQNTAQVTRTVTVADTLAPTMELQGDVTVTITVGQSYSDAGATATDTYDQSITITITITKNGAAFNDGITAIGDAVGEYIITYSTQDAAQNTAQVTRTVTVEAASADTTAPVITLTGDATITLTVGEAYTEYGATATDNADANVTVTIGGDTVNTGVAGEYIITYNAQDAAGNPATEVTRTVNVEAAPVTDTTAPVINLNGASTITLTVGQSYSDAGATATDTFDGTVTVTITITKDGAAFNDGITEIGNAVGEYIITYSAQDAAQNTAQETRTVTVEAANDTTWGDITNDGSIGAADVVYLASYLAGESGFIHGGPSAPAS